MEISREDNANITDMIKKMITGNNYEFEVRICGKNFDSPYKLDYYKFSNILNRLVFSEDLKL